MPTPVIRPLSIRLSFEVGGVVSFVVAVAVQHEPEDAASIEVRMSAIFSLLAYITGLCFQSFIDWV